MELLLQARTSSVGGMLLWRLVHGAATGAPLLPSQPLLVSAPPHAAGPVCAQVLFSPGVADSLTAEMIQWIREHGAGAASGGGGSAAAGGQAKM